MSFCTSYRDFWFNFFLSITCIPFLYCGRVFLCRLVVVFCRLFCHPYFAGFPCLSIGEISTTCPGLVGLCFSSLCWLLFQFSSGRFFNWAWRFVEKLELKNFMSPVAEFFVISLYFLNIVLKIFFQASLKRLGFSLFLLRIHSYGKFRINCLTHHFLKNVLGWAHFAEKLP